MNELKERGELWEYVGYLADVLGVWDCYGQCWHEGAPLVLRFEERDVWLMVSPDGAKLLDESELAALAKLEAVAGLPVSAADLAHCRSGKNNGSMRPVEECLCWRALPTVCRATGSKTTPRQIMSAVAEITNFPR